jgi:uncharacterized protein
MLEFTSTQKEALLTRARIVMAQELGIDHGLTDPDLSDDIFGEKNGLFVTLHKDRQLRGCIGYVRGEKELRKAVDDMALSAAFRDPRFPKLTSEEYPQVDIEISVLSPLEEVKDIDEIQVGVHGLMITRGYHSGLLLPQVAVEQCYDTFTFLQNTCFKAGLQHDAWQREDSVIERFSAAVFGEKGEVKNSPCE